MANLYENAAVTIVFTIDISKSFMYEIKVYTSSKSSEFIYLTVLE